MAVVYKRDGWVRFPFGEFKYCEGALTLGSQVSLRQKKKQFSKADRIHKF